MFGYVGIKACEFKNINVDGVRDDGGQQADGVGGDALVVDAQNKVHDFGKHKMHLSINLGTKTTKSTA